MIETAIPKLTAHKDEMKELMAPFEEFADTY